MKKPLMLLISMLINSMIGAVFVAPVWNKVVVPNFLAPVLTYWEVVFMLFMINAGVRSVKAGTLRVNVLTPEAEA